MLTQGLLNGSVVALYLAAVCIVVVALSRLEVPGKWRRASVAFTGSCLAGVGLLVLLLRADFAYSGITAIAAGILLLQAVGMVWSAVAFRSEMLSIRDLVRGFERDASRRLDSVSGVVATIAPDGTVRRMNRFGLDLLGLTEDEVVGRDVFDLWGTQAAHVHGREEFERFCRSGGQIGRALEYRVNTTRGDRIIRWSRSAVLSEAGTLLEIISYGEDVTEQRRMEEALRSESYLLDAVHDSVIVTRPTGELLYVNRAAHEMRGYEREEFLELEPFSWISPDCLEYALENQRLAAENGSSLYEVTNIRKGGTSFPVEVRSQLVVFDGEPAIMNVSRDVSARCHAERLAAQMAFDDPLTGLPNRRLVNERLRRAIARLEAESAGDLAVIYVDVDNLKAVNDTIGHDGGDRLIKMASDRLSWVTRDGDTLGRVGGDEFVLLVPELAHRTHADDIARRLLEFLSESVEIDGHTVRPSASIGICHCEPGMAPAEALKRADRAMYVAKKSGGNRFAVYEPSMEAAISERFRLKNELAEALDKHELEIVYQPIVDSRERCIVGAEALLRWRHPKRGLLLPEDFLEIAESSGLIVQIGRAVLLEACSTFVGWRERGIAVPRLSVNLSAAQLIDGDLVQDVSGVLRQTGLAPHDLELEITETALMHQVGTVMPVLERLRNMGVGLALDDFGTGHSSLERLQGLPIHTLKIDRSFVSDLCSESGSHPIIDTILVLASKLGLDVVAEGVESPCHLKYLRESGCKRVQGYLFSQPCAASQFEVLAAAGALRFDPEACKPCNKGEGCKLHRLSRSPKTAAAPVVEEAAEFERLFDILCDEIERCAELDR